MRLNQITLPALDVAESMRFHQRLGLVFDQAPRDEPWGWREARLRDPAGLTVCLYHAGAHRRRPPWRVESSAPHHTDPAAAP